MRPFLADRAPDVFLFSPLESERERYAGMTVHRRPLQQPNERRTSRQLGNRYTTQSYTQAVGYACDAVIDAEFERGVASEDLDFVRWTPNQLRHSCGTMVRREFDLETSQVVLGHRRANVTEIYAERDRQRAVAAMLKVG